MNFCQGGEMMGGALLTHIQIRNYIRHVYYMYMYMYITTCKSQKSRVESMSGGISQGPPPSA